MMDPLSYLFAFLAVAVALIVGVMLVLGGAHVVYGRAPNGQVHNEQLVGRWGLVVAAIPLAGVGQVRVAGQTVTTAAAARAWDGGALARDEAVVVIDVDGGVLEVAPLYDRPLLFAAPNEPTSVAKA